MIIIGKLIFRASENFFSNIAYIIVNNKIKVSVSKRQMNGTTGRQRQYATPPFCSIHISLASSTFIILFIRPSPFIPRFLYDSLDGKQLFFSNLELVGQKLFKMNRIVN